MTIDKRLSKILEDTKKSLPEGIDIAILKDLEKAVKRNNREMCIVALSHIDEIMEKFKKKSVLNTRIDELCKEREGLENTDINEIVDDIEKRYCQMLDDCYPKIEIGCITLFPSNVLRKMDPIAYNIGMSDYEDSLASEINDLPEWDDIESQIEGIDESIKDICEEIDEIDYEIAEMIHWGIYYKE